MLQQTASCDRKTCKFSHPSKCVSCGGPCASAVTCVDWQQVKVEAMWGSVIDRVKSKKRL